MFDHVLHSISCRLCRLVSLKNFSYGFLIIVLLTCLTSLEARLQIGIVSNKKFCGEREVAWRIKIAAESLGWKVILDETKGESLFKMKGLDFVICLLSHNIFFNPYCPNYLTVFHPFNFVDENGELFRFYEKYHGYLFTIHETKSIEKAFLLKNKQLNSIPFYPSVHSVPYRKVRLKDLVTMIPVWGNRYTDLKFKRFYHLLSQDGRTKFYGVNRNAHIIPQGYMGKIPFDGVSVIKVLQKHGIVLIMHSDVHNKEGIPSARIFEAAAASVVIISDRNAFVEKHFGDSVFYIDTAQSAEQIYQQVQHHLSTIESDPEKALQMAKRAHQIFKQNFLMSDQLLALEKLHKQVKQNRGKSKS